MAAEHRYTLKEPIPVTRRSGGQAFEEQITEVTVKPLSKARDLKCLDHATGKVEMGIALIAHCCGLAPQAVEEMGIEDFAALTGMVEDFLPAGLKTGVTP